MVLYAMHTHFGHICGFGHISKNTNINFSAYLQVLKLSKQYLLLLFDFVSRTKPLYLAEFLHLHIGEPKHRLLSEAVR